MFSDDRPKSKDRAFREKKKQRVTNGNVKLSPMKNGNTEIRSKDPLAALNNINLEIDKRKLPPMDF